MSAEKFGCVKPFNNINVIIIFDEYLILSYVIIIVIIIIIEGC